MSTPLTKQPTGSSCMGALMSPGRVYRYVVNGLPESEAAYLALCDGRWRILRISKGAREEWTGDYVTDNDALAALQQECDETMPQSVREQIEP